MVQFVYMKFGSKILIGFTVLLVCISLSATFYKTVILQDFKAEGAYIEFPTESSSYVWFVYNNEEYELELESTNYNDILDATAVAIGVSVQEMDNDFLEYLKIAFDDAEIVENGESEALIESDEINGDLDESM